jgi:polyhydroxyalkanoate synthase
VTGLAGRDERELEHIAERYRTFQRVLTTRYPVGQTPKEVIWTLNKARLYRYVPTLPADKRYPVPLFLVFALIKRPYIFDLRPGNSFIEYMVKQGFDVYLIDWGVPGPEDRTMRFDDYVLDYLPRAIRKIKAVSGSEELSMLGWCIGAMLVTLYAALRPDDRLRNLVLLTAPLDFSDKQCGTLARWADGRYVDVTRIADVYGNMPGEIIEACAKALKPVENYIGYFVRLWDSLDAPKTVESLHAMDTWINDVIPMTAAAFRQLIVEFYRENRLMEGMLSLRGELVDLHKVRASLLNVIAERDQLVPPGQSESVARRVGSADTETLMVSAGHIGLMAGSSAVETTWPKIKDWLARRSQE